MRNLKSFFTLTGLPQMLQKKQHLNRVLRQHSFSTAQEPEGRPGWPTATSALGASWPLVLPHGALSLHVFQGLRLYRLHVLLGAVLLLVVQVALEEEFHSLGGQAQVNDPLEDVPGRESSQCLPLGPRPHDS